MRRDERMCLFVQEIWGWYARHKRALLWRDMQIEDDTERAYRVLVSEVMLQQTQVSRVMVIFRRFIEQFPTIHHLAAASNKEVIIAWKGMGYNSRALRLRDAAKSIVDHDQGIFPKELDALRSMKGIGPYTAAAIRNFAFNLPTVCIDTNIRRILHRTFIGPEHADGTWEKKDKELYVLAEEILVIAIDGTAQHSTANWHAALMDFGSMVQTKSHPKWEIDPLQTKGISKTTPRNFSAPTRNSLPSSSASSLQALPRDAILHSKTEPGRMMGARYIPNRIFRGRIVDALRESQEGLTADTIGAQICTDWSREHQAWLQSLLEQLHVERLIMRKRGRFMLDE